MRISFLEGNSRFLSAGLSLNKPSPHQQIVEFMSYKIISFDAANPVSLYNGIRETKPTGKHRTCPVPEVPRHDTTRHDTTFPINKCETTKPPPRYFISSVRTVHFYWEMLPSRPPRPESHKSITNLKNVGTSTVTLNKVDADDSPILGATI